MSTPALKRQVAPGDDETFDEFMSRCVDDEGNDPDECQIVWDERAGDKAIVRKTHVSKADGLDFVMSDETVDRLGEVIKADGWELDEFATHPVALFNHNANFVIGNWENVHVERGALRGRLKLAKENTSERINELRSLVEQGILKAVSVGFRPLVKQPVDDKADKSFGPFKYLKHKLIECSLVSIPANPNALAIAKGLKVSDDTLRMVFAKHGEQDTARDYRRNGKQAETRTRKNKPMSTLADRIKDGQKHLTELKDALKAHLDDAGSGNVDEQLDKTNNLNAEISQTVRTLEALRESERNLGETSEDGGRSIVTTTAKPLANPAVISPRPFGMPKKQVTPIDLFCRAGALMTLAHSQRKSIAEVCRATGYGDDEQTKAVIDWQTKAASAVASTTLSHWALELVQVINAEFMQTLMPQSVFPRLSALGLQLSFGRNGKILIPTRDRTPTIAGSFVGEGLPIPVRQGSFTSVPLYPKKMAVITTWTREIDEHSVPAIQALLRDAIQQDTAVALDAILLDATASSTIRPPGLLNGVSGLTPTAGGGFTALVGDIKQLSNALLVGTAGNVRSPVWLMNPAQANSIGLVSAPSTGVFPFREEIGQGRLGGWPVIISGTVPATTVVALDAADFVSVSEGPRFEVSDQATLHMDDTTPTDISTTGSPAVVAFPAKSMFQTDSMALRLILPMNWILRRTGVVAWATGVTW